MTAHKKWGAVAVGLTALMATTALGVGGAGAEQQSVFALPRAQTLYMSGNQWSPNNDLNPAKNWDYITGLVGFVQTPFRYDPLKDTFIPWLATSGKWTSKTTFSMTIRKNVKWTDGQALKPSDVKYSFDLAKISTHPQLALWTDTGLKSTKVSRSERDLHTGNTPGYQQFSFYRFNVAIVPQHLQELLADGHHDGQPRRGQDRPEPARTSTSPASAPSLRRSSGGRTSTGGPGGPRPEPRTQVRRRHPQRLEYGALASFKGKGNIDLFNNYAPKAAITGNVKTYFGKAPYHLGANTTWLFPNTTRKPMNDRTAPSCAGLLDQHGPDHRQGLPGPRPERRARRGLLPIWSKWVDQRASRQWGFSYNANRAKAILAQTAATGTATATGSSRTRTDRRST